MEPIMWEQEESSFDLYDKHVDEFLSHEYRNNYRMRFSMVMDVFRPIFIISFSQVRTLHVA